MKIYQTTSFWENRVYPANKETDKIEKAVVPGGDKKEKKGAGIRSYGKVVGRVAALFGLTFKLKVKEKNFIYVNKNSFCKFVLRNQELKDRPESQQFFHAPSLQQSYRLHKRTPYEFLKKTKEYFEKKEHQPIVLGNLATEIDQSCKYTHPEQKREHSASSDHSP